MTTNAFFPTCNSIINPLQSYLFNQASTPPSLTSILQPPSSILNNSNAKGSSAPSLCNLCGTNIHPNELFLHMTMHFLQLQSVSHPLLVDNNNSNNTEHDDQSISPKDDQAAFDLDQTALHTSSTLSSSSSSNSSSSSSAQNPKLSDDSSPFNSSNPTSFLNCFVKSTANYQLLKGSIKLKFAHLQDLFAGVGNTGGDDHEQQDEHAYLDRLILFFLELIVQNENQYEQLYQTVDRYLFKMADFRTFQKQNGHFCCSTCNQPQLFVWTANKQLYHQIVQKSSDIHSTSVKRTTVTNMLKDLNELTEKLVQYRLMTDEPYLNFQLSQSNDCAPVAIPTPALFNSSNKLFFKKLSTCFNPFVGCSTANHGDTIVNTTVGSTNSIGDMNSDHGPKRSRTRLNETQLSVLRSYFDISNSPSDEKILEICHKTGLQEKVVKHWFRNTLFKERQKNKDNPYNFAIPPSTSLDLEEYEKTGRIELRPAGKQSDDDQANDDECPNLEMQQSMMINKYSSKSSVCSGQSDFSACLSPDSNKRQNEHDLNLFGTSQDDLSSTTSKRMRIHKNETIANNSNEIYHQTDDNDLSKFNPNLSNLSNAAESLSPISDVPLSPDMHSTVRCIDDPHNVLATLLRLGAHKQMEQSFGSTGKVKSTNQISNLMSSLAHMSNLHETTNSEHPLDLSAKSSAVRFVFDSTEHKNALNLMTDDIKMNEAKCNLFQSFHSPNTLLLNDHALSNVYHSFSNSTTTSTISNGRRNRTSITALQSRCMHLIYNYHKTPSVHECDKIGDIIGLTRRVVQVWFQNQRAKEKKMARVSFTHPGADLGSLMGKLNTSQQQQQEDNCMNATYCYICGVPISSYDQMAQAQSPTMSKNMSPLNQTSFTSHASFVDHLFSSGHLKKLLKWCSIETN